MKSNCSEALLDYVPAFQNTWEPFIFYYYLRNSKVHSSKLTRGEFWTGAKKAAWVIRKYGCRRGDRIIHCFGANNFYDLAFRLGAAMTGAIPVTINWQADNIQRILYKIEVTDSRLIVTDSHFNPDYLNSIKIRFPHLPLFFSDNLDTGEVLPEEDFVRELEPESTRIIVFTSGTTGKPKGVQLPYRAYRTNRYTFEEFLQVDPEDRFAVLAVNPLHHTNSTAITDWAMRRPGSQIHLIERYSTQFWKILKEVSKRNYDRLIIPTVSRHFDFLESLERERRLPLEFEELKQAMSNAEFLIGSAPVGPTTIRRLRYYTGCLPHVRFGSTETCLQVIGTPVHLCEEAKLSAFKRGWDHRIDGGKLAGYYIGRPHPPFTEARIVKSLVRGNKDFMKDCGPGRAGYLVTRGENLMTGYVKDPESTRDAFRDGWYTGLKDICFYLQNEGDGELDYYWVSRESTLLIRGGANYSYDQINSELIDFVRRFYRLTLDSFDLAVVGLRLESEHEDSCCVTVETKDQKAESKRGEMETTFRKMAPQYVSKGARPDHVRFSAIPRNFKGAVQVKKLAADFEDWLKSKVPVE